MMLFPTIILLQSLFCRIINGQTAYYSANYIYIDSSPQRTWEDADEYCFREYGTHLASIKSAHDQVEKFCHY